MPIRASFSLTQPRRTPFIIFSFDCKKREYDKERRKLIDTYIYETEKLRVFSIKSDRAHRVIGTVLNRIICINFVAEFN